MNIYDIIIQKHFSLILVILVIYFIIVIYYMINH